METFDTAQIFCRKLGHYVPFKYCRSVNDSLPCGRIIDCTFEKFPVEEFLRKNFSAEEIEKAFNPPADKISSLVELIERAKKLS